MSVIKIDIESGEEIGNDRKSDTGNNDEKRPEITEINYPQTELQIPLNHEMERQSHLPPGLFIDKVKINNILDSWPRESN